MSALGNTSDAIFRRLYKFENAVAAIEELEEFKGLNTHLGAKLVFAHPAHWTRKTTRTMGTVAQYALCASENAVADAALNPADLESGRCGVAYGSCSGSIDAHLDLFSMFFDHELKNVTSSTYIKLMPQTCAFR